MWLEKKSAYTRTNKHTAEQLPSFSQLIQNFSFPSVINIWIETSNSYLAVHVFVLWFISKTTTIPVLPITINHREKIFLGIT